MACIIYRKYNTSVKHYLDRLEPVDKCIKTGEKYTDEDCNEVECENWCCDEEE